MFAVVRVVFSRSLGFAVKQQRTFAVSSSLSSERRSYRLVVVGGGTAGCAIGSKFGSHFGSGKVAIVEPRDVSSRQRIRSLCRRIEIAAFILRWCFLLARQAASASRLM